MISPGTKKKGEKSTLLPAQGEKGSNNRQKKRYEQKALRAQRKEGKSSSGRKHFCPKTKEKSVRTVRTLKARPAGPEQGKRKRSLAPS